MLQLMAAAQSHSLLRQPPLNVTALFSTDGTAISKSALDLISVNLLLPQLHFAMRNCSKVVLSLSNMAYQAVFESWYESVRQPPGCALIIAWDSVTCEYLEIHQLPAVCMKEPASLAETYAAQPRIFDPEFREIFAVAMAKMVFPWALLQHGCNVALSEMDVFWATDCLAELEKEEHARYDVQVSNQVLYPGFHSSRGEVNIGFFYVRSTTASLLMFADMLAYAVTHALPLGSHRTFDQKLFDRFLRHQLAPGDEPCQWNHRFGDFAAFAASKTWHQTLRWRRLPILLFPTNIGRRGSKLQFHNATLAVHISFGIKEPNLRMYCAHRLGLVSANSSYRPPPSLSSSQRFCFELFDAHGNFTRRIG